MVRLCTSVWNTIRPQTLLPATRISLVKLRPDISRQSALDSWLGAHADVVRTIPGVTSYVVALAEESRSGNQWDAVATLRFTDRAALEAAFADPLVAEALSRTREPFLERVDPFVVDEHVVIDELGTRL